MRKILSVVLSFGLLFQQSGLLYAAGEINLANYLSQAKSAIVQPDQFRPPQLRYISYDIKSNDFKLLLDKGDRVNQRTEELKNQRTMELLNSLNSLNSSTPKLNNATQELFNYFLIGLSLPNDTFWVNLRPDAPENIIDPLLEKTDIGKIFLEADLQLKKDTASLTSPQNPEGKVYWDKLYKKAGELFGTENITIPTITRPWIVPNEVIVRETEDSAYIYKATLKVMLEEDYLRGMKDDPAGASGRGTIDYSFNDPRLKELNEYSTQLIRETIIPKLTKEINSSKRYAQLRQVYYSLVLARWFKQKYSSLGSISAPESPSTSSLANSYISLIDSGNLVNLASQQPCDKQTYFQAYQKSFKDGEYNLKETVSTPFGQSIRSYISGGLGMGFPYKTVNSPVTGIKVNSSPVTNILTEQQPLATTASPINQKVSSSITELKNHYAKIYAQIHGESKEEEGYKLSLQRLGGEDKIKALLADPVLSNNEDKEVAIEALVFGKGSIFYFWDELAEGEKRGLIRQLKEKNMQEIEELINRFVVKKEKGLSVEISSKDIIEAPLVYDTTKGGEIYEKAKAEGVKAYKKGEVAVVTLGGGSGSRSGLLPGSSKFAVPASQVMDKSLGQMQAERIRALAEKYGKPVPWIIMTSDVTEEGVIKFFNENIKNGKYFNQVPKEWVYFIRQRSMPQFTDTGEFILENNKHKIISGGFGHGDVRDYVLRDKKVLKWLGDFGVKYVQMVNVDNAFLPGPEVIGYHILSGENLARGVEHLSIVTVHKEDPRESVGLPMLVNGKRMMIEYSQLVGDLAYLRYTYLIDGHKVVFVKENGDNYFMLSQDEFSKNYKDGDEKKLLGINELPDDKIFNYHGVEYSKAMMKERGSLLFSAANTNTLVWSLFSFQDEKYPLADLPVSVARKKVKGFSPGTRDVGEIVTFKLEGFSFGGQGSVEKVEEKEVLLGQDGAVVKVPRQNNFAPIKNGEKGMPDTLYTARDIFNETDKQPLTARFWTILGASIVELSPAFMTFRAKDIGENGFLGPNARLYLSGKNTRVGNNLKVGKDQELIVKVEDEYAPKAKVSIGKNVTINSFVSFTLKGDSVSLEIEDGVVFDRDNRMDIVLNDGEHLRINKDGPLNVRALLKAGNKNEVEKLYDKYVSADDENNLFFLKKLLRYYSEGPSAYSYPVLAGEILKDKFGIASSGIEQVEVKGEEEKPAVVLGEIMQETHAILSNLTKDPFESFFNRDKNYPYEIKKHGDEFCNITRGSYSLITGIVPYPDTINIYITEKLSSYMMPIIEKYMPANSEYTIVKSGDEINVTIKLKGHSKSKAIQESGSPLTDRINLAIATFRYNFNKSWRDFSALDEIDKVGKKEIQDMVSEVNRGVNQIIDKIAGDIIKNRNPLLAVRENISDLDKLFKYFHRNMNEVLKHKPEPKFEAPPSLLVRFEKDFKVLLETLNSIKNQVSSAIGSEVIVPVVKRGGIDLTDRMLKIKLERVGSFASSSLALPEIADLDALDLDKEYERIQAMVSSSIRPSDTRILEFAAACYYKGEFDQRLTQVSSCIKGAHLADEISGRDSSEALRLATMLPDALYGG